VNQDEIMTGFRRLRLAPTAALLAAGLALAGCAGDQAPPTPNARLFGLASGPLPPPKPFVVETRSSGPNAYPAVGITPPARTDKVLSEPERAKLEADLKRYSNPNAPASGRSGFSNFTKKPKKPVPPGQPTPAT
jgi:hypothetical protein